MGLTELFDNLYVLYIIMTPEQALSLLKQAVSLVKATLSEHQAIQEAIMVIGKTITANQEGKEE